MGHTRLGKVPKSQKWINVIQTLASSEEDGDLVSASDNVEAIATETLQAAQGYLKSASNDLGLRFTFYLLARVALASRDGDWKNKLRELGIHLNEDDSLLEFTAEFQNAIDEYLAQNRHASDISEIAQQAAGEALT